MSKKLPRKTCVRCGEEFIVRASYFNQQGWCGKQCWKYDENKAPRGCCDSPQLVPQNGCVHCMACGMSYCE